MVIYVLIKTIKEKYVNSSLPVRAAFWYIVCNIVNKGIALLSTPIFTRILTEEQYGDYALFHSWYSILLIFTSFNIFLSGYTKGLLKYKDDINRFTASQLSLSFTITFAWFVIYLVSIPFWTNLLQIQFHLMIAMFAQLLLMPAMELWMSKERFSYNYKSIVIITLLCNFLSVVAGVIVVLVSSHKLEARIYSDVLVKVAFAGVLFVLIMVKGKTFYNKEWWKYALKFNFPLIPHYLANYVLNQSDRLMIGRMVGSKEAGFYSVAYTVSMMMFLIVNAINNAVEPNIYKSIEAKRIDNIKKFTVPLLALVAGLTVGVMAFAPEVIYIFAGTKYMDAIYVIPPISVAVYFIFVYSLFSTVEYYYQKTAFIAVATTISALLNLLLNFFGINIFGYYAAGYTTLICYIVLAMLHYIFYKKIIIENMSDIRELYNFKAITTLGVFLLIIMILMASTYNILVIRYGMIAILFVVFVIKRKNIIYTFMSLKK